MAAVVQGSKGGGVRRSFVGDQGGWRRSGVNPRKGRIRSVLRVQCEVGGYQVRKSREQVRFERRGSVAIIRDVLSREAFLEVTNECQSLRHSLRSEHGSVAQGRIGCVMSCKSNAYRLLQNAAVKSKVARAIGQEEDTLAWTGSIVPMEHRVYRPGSGMDWHVDDQLFVHPQFELVYTIYNTSDASTEWLDANGRIQREHTEPNSLLIIKASTSSHRVPVLKRGERGILKFVCAQAQSELVVRERDFECLYA